MFDFIHKHKRLIQVVLAIVFLPFAFFGVDSYFNAGGAGEGPATVGKSRISQQEFNQALRERQEAIQRITEGKAGAALLDNPQLRFAVLDGLIRRHLLIEHAVRSGMTSSDEELRNMIAAQPAFQDNGRFSLERYQQFLRSQGLTEPMFEAQLRRDLLLQHIGDAYSGSNFVPRTVARRVLRITAEQREVSQFAVTPEQFLPQVKLEADAARKYYDSHQNEFRVPEQVRVEYVALASDSLLSQVQIDPDEVRKYYESHLSQYGTSEERKASHILISVDAGAGADARQKARAKADEIYAELKRNPSKFAELAKQYSQDPGSAANGGDLGYFSRGSMVKPFEDAVFKMKTGDISPPVETQYGFHVIQLTGIKPGETRSFDDVRSQLETALKKERVGRKFAEVAENFNNVVFEQSESLKPAAELAKTAVEQSGWITREHADETRLNNPKLLQSIFSEEVLKNKRNSEAVEVSPGVLVSARLLQHKAASVQPFDQVSAAIVKKLTRERAGQLAVQDGREILEKLRQGKDAQVTWGAPQLVSRDDVKGMSEPALREILKTDVAKLPAFSGIENPQGGFTLFRITKVVEPEQPSGEKQKQIAGELQQVVGQEEMSAFIDSLKQKTAVKINDEFLEKKDR